jgi:hypothetical protein
MVTPPFLPPCLGTHAALVQLARKEESIKALESAREQLRSAQSERSRPGSRQLPSLQEAQVGGDRVGKWGWGLTMCCSAFYLIWSEM